MKFVKVLVIVVLAGSLIGNFVLVKRMDKNRAQIQINDRIITKKDLHDRLEADYGRETTAKLVEMTLITQAAEKAGVKPDPNEVDEAIENQRERNPLKAFEYKIKPWKVDQDKEAATAQLALINLSIKDVKATDDEIHDFFTQHPGAWDKPDKVYVKAVQCLDQDTAERAKEMMSRVTDLSVIGQQLSGKAGVYGADGTWVFVKPVGGPALPTQPDAALINKLAAMKPGDVTIIPAGKQGFFAMKFEKIVPGKKVTLDEVKDKVARAFKATRRTPDKEILRKLWDQANIQTEDAALKSDIERLIFPERVNQRQAAAQ